MSRRAEIEAWHAHIGSLTDPVALERLRTEIVAEIAAPPRTTEAAEQIAALVEARDLIDLQLANLSAASEGPQNMKAPTYEYHPLANLFPMIGDEEQLATFRASIKAEGITRPIVLLDGKILDGRNRYEAARAVGREVPERQFGDEQSDGTDPLRFVLRENAERRHLTDDQRRVVAAKVAAMGVGPKTETPTNGRSPVTVAAAAKALNVDPKGVERAKSVYAKGTPELQKAMESGQVTVRAAADVAKLDREEQRTAVAAGPQAVKDKVREVRESTRPVLGKDKPPLVAQAADTADPLTGPRPNLPVVKLGKAGRQVHVLADGHLWLAEVAAGPWSPGTAVVTLVQIDRRQGAGPKRRKTSIKNGWKEPPARITLPAYSSAWWAIVRRTVEKGGGVRFHLDQARAGTGWTLPAAEAPSEEETAALVEYPPDSEDRARWAARFKSMTGFPLPAPPAPVWLPPLPDDVA